MLTSTDHLLYKQYKKLKNPEYFQKYFMKWYELGGKFQGSQRCLQAKIQIYKSLGMSDKRIAETQTIVSHDTMLKYIRGKIKFSPKKCAIIYKNMPKLSEKKTVKKITSPSY